jgi:hypothetical protein
VWTVDVMSAASELDAMLADLAEQAQAIRDFQCQHGLDRHSTRKQPKWAIAAINDWRRAVAAATMCNSVVAIATASRIGTRQTNSSSPSAEQEQ